MAEVAAYDAVFTDRTACWRLSESIYARVMRDPVLRPLFPGKTLNCAVEELAAYLTQLLGGPAELTQRRWWISIRESHARFRIGATQRDAWLTHMHAALDDASLSDAGRAALRGLVDPASADLVNVAPDGVGVVETWPTGPNRLAIAALLLSRGADPDAPDSRGITPARAARNDAMRRLFAGRS